MSAKFTQSFRLEKLWDRIVDKDSQDEAEAAFRDVATRYYDQDDYSLLDLFDNALELDGEYFAFEYDDVLYFYDEETEVKAYNAVLRQWCENTGRRIKTKKSPKK